MNPLTIIGVVLLVILGVVTFVAWRKPEQLRPTWFWYVTLIVAVALAIAGRILA